MNDWQFIVLMFLIPVCTSFILDRLPKSKHHSDFRSELCDGHVTFRVDELYEYNFNVEFVDGWGLGRDFSLIGPVIHNVRQHEGSQPEFGPRISLKIGAMSDWFSKSQIGFISTHPNKRCESFIALPYQIARHALEDVRRSPGLFVTLGYKRVTDKNGKTRFSIFRFELSSPSD